MLKQSELEEQRYTWLAKHQGILDISDKIDRLLFLRCTCKRKYNPRFISLVDFYIRLAWCCLL